LKQLLASIFYSILFLGTFSSFANVKSEKTCLPTLSHIVNSSSTSPKNMLEVLSVIQDVKKELLDSNSFLDTPKGLDYIIHDVVEDPHFLKGKQKSVAVGRSYLFRIEGLEYYILPELTKGVTAHEYGHAIFDTNLIKHLDGFEEYQKQIIEQSRLKKGFLKEEMKFKAKLLQLNNSYRKVYPYIGRYEYGEDRVFRDTDMFNDNRDLFELELQSLGDSDKNIRRIKDLLNESHEIFQGMKDFARTIAKVDKTLVEKDLFKTMKHLEGDIRGMNEMFADLTARANALNFTI
jgi:hypothetical protein